MKFCNEILDFGCCWVLVLFVVLVLFGFGFCLFPIFLFSGETCDFLKFIFSCRSFSAVSCVT